MLVVLFSLCVPLVSSAAGSRQLLVVTQSTVLRGAVPAGGIGPVGRESKLSAGTVVIGEIVDEHRLGQGQSGYWNIVTTESQPREGRVSSLFVMPLSNYAVKLVEQKGKLKGGNAGEAFYRPWLIRFQENPSVSVAWGNVNELIALNEKLADDERLAEPYFARAELWVAVENYADAIQDYITGINISKKRGVSADYYLKYVEKLLVAVQKLEANPVPAVGVRLGWAEAALQHYKLGYTPFFTGDYEECLVHFTNSVTMDPKQPHYWYFRALAQRALGNDQQSQHDALLGVHFEQQLPADAISMDQRLFRVQGKRRTWLEKFRNGLMAFHLLGPSKVALAAVNDKTSGQVHED